LEEKKFVGKKERDRTKEKREKKERAKGKRGTKN
jgi:hypothetical protein